MNLPDFLNAAPDGEIRLTGHRIGLFHLVQSYNEGESAEMIACRYPTLPLALVHKVIAFYLDNHVEVDEYVAAASVALKDQRDTAKQFDIGLLRRRLAAKEPLIVTPEPQVH